eukprot:1391559-Prymnesium_polylepis.1
MCKWKGNTKGAALLPPPEVQLLLTDGSWRRSEQRSIELPSSVVVPQGALQKKSSRRSLLMRSTCQTPLTEQVVALTAVARIVSTQLDESAEGVEYLRDRTDTLPPWPRASMYRNS